MALTKKHSTTINRLKIAGIIAIPLVLLILPATFFDQGESICLSKMLLDRECPGCGMTRGIQHLIHFDLDGAMHYNKLSLVVAPLLIYVGITEILRSRKKIKKEKVENRDIIQK